jgi:MFS family permease
MRGVDVQKLADEAELNRFHYLTIAWLIVIAMLDGYDIGVTGATLPAIMADLKIDATTGGAIASASLTGMAFGWWRLRLHRNGYASSAAIGHKRPFHIRSFGESQKKPGDR